MQSLKSNISQISFDPKKIGSELKLTDFGPNLLYLDVTWHICDDNLQLVTFE